MAKVDLIGLDDLIANFQKLPELFADDLRSAANTGASVIRDEVVIRVPRATGLLAEEIYQKHIPEASNKVRQTYIVSWRKGGKGQKGAYYGFWVEYGHWYVPPKAKGITWKAHRNATKTIFVAANPFLRPAFEAKARAAVDAMRQKLAENVQRTIASFNK